MTLTLTEPEGLWASPRTGDMLGPRRRAASCLLAPLRERRGWGGSVRDFYGPPRHHVV